MSASQSHIVALARKILENAEALDEFHTGNNLPQPSLDEDGASTNRFPAETEKSRAIISDACEELNAIVQGPMKTMHARVLPHVIYLDAIKRFDIANKVPIQGKISYADLANSNGISESALRRVMRWAISCNVFAEREPGYLSHSAASRWLVDDPTAFPWLGAYLHTTSPAQRALGQALEKWPQAEEGSQTGYMIANNANEPSFYMHMAKDPARIKDFSMAMRNFATSPGNALRHLVDNYPWSDLGSGTVVDMGGSTGAAAFAVAEKYPHLNFVVQDLPDTIAQAQESSGVNVKFMAHSFFDTQPVKGAAMYMSRWCFHNYSDKYCNKILEALVPALQPGSRIMIMDAVMPDINADDVLSTEKRRLRNMDCSMLSMSNSAEREVEDWKRLFASVDSRFQWAGITVPKGSNLALIEAVWKP